MSKRSRMAEHEQPSIVGSLAEKILNTRDPNDINGSLKAAHEALTGKPISALRFNMQAKLLMWILSRAVRKTERPDNAMYKVKPDHTERALASAALLDIFKKRELTFATTLRSLPMYEHLYRQHSGDRPEQIDPDRKALLVGSMTSLSSRAFRVMAEEVYKTPNSYVVDIHNSKDKARPENGTFVQGNGLHLPFADNSMHIVQTNFLLHMLIEEPDDIFLPEDKEQATTQQLFHELLRVARPGGELLMNEIPPRLDYQNKDFTSEYNQARIRDFKTLLEESLSAAGFTHIAIEPGWHKQGVDYLFDPD